MYCTESRFVIGPPNILSAGVYVCTFQPGNVASSGSERVKAGELADVSVAERALVLVAACRVGSVPARCVTRE